jgi:hypothetical protein
MFPTNLSSLEVLDLTNNDTFSTFLLVICMCIATVFIYDICIFTILKHQFQFYFNKLQNVCFLLIRYSECGANNQGTNTHLYIICHTRALKKQSQVHLIHAPKKTTYIITECIEINVTI